LERDRDQQRKLIYTGITRGKRLLVLVGPRKALGDRFPQRPPTKAVFGVAGEFERGWVGEGIMTLRGNARNEEFRQDTRRE